MSIDLGDCILRACPACGVVFDLKTTMTNYDYRRDDGSINSEMTVAYCCGTIYKIYKKVRCPACDCLIDTDVEVK